MREGAQNAGDAIRGGEGPVRIRISFGSLPSERVAAYTAGLMEHIPEIAKLKGMSAVEVVGKLEQCKFLAFEDFGTTGLTGDPHLERRYDGDPPNAFHTFFRAEGQTDKVDERKQGSKGVGKITFMAASHARVVLGLTCREDDARTLLFGTAVLPEAHRVDGADYDGDAWFGRNVDDRVQAIEDAETTKEFSEDFQLARQPGQPGFSIVIPWPGTLNDEDGVTPPRVVQAVLRDHAWPIFQNKLVIEVVDYNGTVTTVDSAHYLEVLDAQSEHPGATHSSARRRNWRHGATAHPPAMPTDRLALAQEYCPRHGRIRI